MVEQASHTKSRFEAFILAGGVSSRMGVAKHQLDFSGEPLILYTIRLLKPLVEQVTIVGLSQDSWRNGVRAIPDGNFGIAETAGRSKGPLVGLATALAHSKSPWNLVLACDLPFLTSAWLGWLLARAETSQSHIVVPRTAHGLEPLAALYRGECARPIVQSLLNGTRKAADLLNQFTLETVDANEWHEVDPEGQVLKNMNTTADYIEALKWFPRKGFQA